MDTLVALGRWLGSEGYDFTTVTPGTQARVNARPDAGLSRDLRGIFGWSRPFAPELLPTPLRQSLREAGLAVPVPGGWRSTVRFSSLVGHLFAHSAFPTVEADAVFFGPDTVRFVELIRQTLHERPVTPPGRTLDVGCGAGPGGIAAARWAGRAEPQLVLADINRRALEFARANAVLAGCVDPQVVHADLYDGLGGRFDLIVGNPPYLVDGAARTYRHGGGTLGADLSLRLVSEGLPRLAPGGRLVLYTGAAIVEGRDALQQAFAAMLRDGPFTYRYREIDPDVFGEELDAPAYAGVERIAAVGLVVQALS